VINLATVFHLTRPLNVFDLETTGTGDDARAVQIAITLHYPDKEPISWQSLVNPEVPIPGGSTSIHGITTSMVAEAPTFAALVKVKLMERAFTNVDFCGFNVRFDLNVMKRECKRVGHRWNWEDNDSLIVDGFRIFQQKHPRDLAAAHLVYLGQPLKHAHEASADVAATERVIQAQLLQHTDLPRDVPGLARFCSGDAVDKTGKLRWRNGEACLAFGKYNGRPLQATVQEDRQYFTKFILGGDFPGDFQRIIAEAVAGRFPRRASGSM
jgi:DNA polymerase-3 subunit epsilon